MRDVMLIGRWTTVLRVLLLCCAVPAFASAKPQQGTQPTRQAAAAQAEWEKVSQAIGKIPPEKQTKDSIPLVDAFLRRYPNFGEAHFIQARSYEDLGSQSLPITPEQRRALENALKHYGRAADLLTDPKGRFISLWKMQQIYDMQLAQPAEAERVARRMVAEHPTRGEGHMTLAQMLREKGDIAGAVDVLRKGRIAAPDMPLAGLLLLDQSLLEYVQGSRGLSREIVRPLLDEAVSVSDAIIAHPESDDQNYRLGTLAKSVALELQAERVEQDRQRRLALLLESRHLSSPIEDLKKNPKPPTKPLSAKEAAALEWEYEDRWIWRRVIEGDHAGAVAGYQKYIAAHPDFDPPIVRLADAYLQWADAATDAAVKRTAWQGALAPLQRLIGLAPTLDERTYAFERVISVLGPAKLNRIDLEEQASRTMMQHYPGDAAAYYTLVDVLVRANRTAEVDPVLRAARKAVKPTVASRTSMARHAVEIVRAHPDLPAASARRLFDEADALLTEAEKLGPSDPDVMAGRGSWMIVKAERFEPDPKRQQALNEQGKRLLARSIELRQKKR